MLRLPTVDEGHSGDYRSVVPRGFGAFPPPYCYRCELRLNPARCQRLAAIFIISFDTATHFGANGKPTLPIPAFDCDFVEEGRKFLREMGVPDDIARI
jgi:hypothetical protein